MKFKRKFWLTLGILIVGVLLSSGVDAAFSDSTNNWQSYPPTFDKLYPRQMGDIWPILNQMENDQCEATSDFIIGIPPGGCTPSVVRSDLLEEQNVPVFCQLYAIKVNPLIEVFSIKSISFKNKPEGVSSVVFHPARAAVKSYTTLLGDPTLNNIGYVVIILKREKVEKNMAEWIAGNLTATIRYDAEEAYGTGASDYYLPFMSEEDWDKDYVASSFWNGRGYLRTMSVGDGRAKIQLLTSKDKVIRTFDLKEGETSESIYLPGYYCKAGLKIKLNDIVAPAERALLNIDGQTLWVRKGTKFLNEKCRVTSLDVENHSDGSIKISCSGAGTISPLSLTENKNIELSEDEYIKKGGDKISKGLVEEYFEKSKKIVVDELVGIYGSEEKENGETFGEEALYGQIVLAGNVGKFKTKKVLMDLFIDEYPSSKIVEQIRSDRQRMNWTNYSNSYTSVYVNDKFHSISVVDFKPGKEGKREVDLKIGGKIINNINEGWNVRVGGGNLSIEEILPGKVKVYFKGIDKDVKSKTVLISEGGVEVFDGVEVSVRDVEVTEIAYVSLIPEVKQTKTEANFTFRIGIEKRAIELSPERAEEMLKNINESIVRWEGIVDRLGNVISGLKGACFATSGILMLKNMVSGFSGAAMARQEVMKEYKKICDSNKEYDSRTECYNDKSEEIEKAVADMTGVLKGVNDDMGGVMEDNPVDSGGLFGGKSIGDSAKYREDLRNKIGVEDVNVNVSGEVIPVPIGKVDTESSLRAVMTWKKAKEVGGISEDIAKAKMDMALRIIALREKQDDLLKEKVTNSIQNYGVKLTANDVAILTDKETKYILYSGRKGSYFGLSGGDAEKSVQIVSTSMGKNYLVVLSGVSKGIMGIDNVYNRDGGKWISSGDNVPSDLNNVVFSSKSSAGSCSNSWIEGKAEVSYYEYGDNKGLPAIVPFDLKEGWYAMVSNSGGTFVDSSPQGYTASADVRYFYVCNIGSNRLMDNRAGDDLCQSFDANTLGAVDSFGGCSDVDVKTLYNRAREAIRQASSQYGKKTVNIFDQIMEMGKPMSQVGGFECQDFMSPADCKLMFNVCDPVICPPSRCDLGGKFPVSDVIQTGIVGSLVLCLPNAREGIAIPICLSGVHAGLESYLSILRSEADCLQHSLDTGEVVGICDEITSIYKCEFFWRQLSPVMDQLIPGMIEYTISGGRVRGGGEYALVQQSWNVMRQSVSYFKKVYAQNAFRAFNIRSTEEVGSTFCKAFVGTSVPGSADLIESLLEPESPSQFYAQFSETLFTEATVPATSQYKVYYHIYAGNDKGVQYKVYLKNPPETSYYRTNPSVQVKSGYIAKGSSADETIDFTAPAGYKELCVVIDAKEECGFKQVTTDFGLDYVKKKYVEEQAEKSDITTENECISGSPSALSMVNLNLQAGAEEMANPEIALQGIVRVCASVNPASGVADSRWKDVGYCGDSSMRCWLDVDSVKKDLEALEVIGGSSISVLDEQRDLIKNERLSLEQVRESLSSIRGRVKGLNESELGNPSTGKVNEIILELDNIIGSSTLDGDKEDISGAGTNVDRAEALALKATVYRMVVMEMRKGEVVRLKPSANVLEISMEGSLEIDGDKEVYAYDESLSESRNKVLAMCEKLEGEPRYEGDTNCFLAVEHVYNNAEVLMNCVYSDGEKSYFIGGVEDVNDLKYVGEVVTKNVRGARFAVNPSKCDYSGLSEKAKLSKIKSGDVLSIVYDVNQGHNVIFIEWKNKKENIARVFDWTGAGKTYTYREYDLSDNAHPVYMYWEPV